MIRTGFLNRGKTTREQIMSDEGSQELKQRCEAAYIRQGQQMAAEGVNPVLIENVAHAAGMAEGPLTLAGDNWDGHSSNQENAEVEIIKTTAYVRPGACGRRKLGSRNRPGAGRPGVDAGLGLSSYAGGVMSYMDTMGLNAFITLCDELNAHTSAGLSPSDWLRRRAQEDDRVYPSTV